MDRDKWNRFVKGNKASVVHGIYTERLFDHEKVIYANIKLGSLDEELKMLRILLRRKYADLVDFEEMKEHQEHGQDLTKTIEMLKERLKMLEEERARLIVGRQPYDDEL